MSIDSVGALESIQKLERDPFELFAVIGRQLRALYHANRGEVLEAEQHRAEADDRARQLGAGWQVELWEPAAQMPLHIAINDVVGLARTVHRLAELERAVPSMRFYRHLAECALEGARREDIAGLDAETEAVLREATRLLMEREPRSFIGWAVATSYIAATYNRVGRFEQARELLESAQRLTTDGDRDFVNLFLDLDLQTAYAHAGLGRLGEALQRLDALIARFSNTRHQLALGLLHEARARISFAAGDLASYREHVRATEAYLRPLRAHALIVRCDRLIALGITKAEAASSSEDYTVDQTTDVTEAVTAPGPRR
jgi:tetratricopeptide (TPR) repeat protein